MIRIPLTFLSISSRDSPATGTWLSFIMGIRRSNWSIISLSIFIPRTGKLLRNIWRISKTSFQDLNIIFQEKIIRENMNFRNVIFLQIYWRHVLKSTLPASGWKDVLHCNGSIRKRSIYFIKLVPVANSIFIEEICIWKINLLLKVFCDNRNLNILCKNNFPLNICIREKEQNLMSYWLCRLKH